jgi:hypothetical protein
VALGHLEQANGAVEGTRPLPCPTSPNGLKESLRKPIINRVRLHTSSLRAAAGACCAGLVLLAAGCGTSSGPTADGAVVNVTERDFGISIPSRLPAGPVVLHVHNDGPDAHELIVVRLGGRALPIRADGMTVNEEALEPSIVGSLEPGRAGSTRNLAFKLAPGRYEVMCNMEGHYMGGMHRRFVVPS